MTRSVQIAPDLAAAAPALAAVALPDAPARSPASQRLLALPLGLSLLLAASALLPQVREFPRELAAFLGAALLLAGWTCALWLQALRSGRALTARFVLRRPHWLQPLVQGSVYLYWGFYWRQVYASAPLIFAQLVFAYAFDLLLSWSRGDEVELGMGPFPIVFSINLFLWFKPDWFWLQFVMIGFGFAAKQLLRWRKADAGAAGGGRLTHIFNPSSFPLAIASVVLLLLGKGDLTWGPEIARTFDRPPFIWEMLFLVSLPGQLLFGTAAMSMPAMLSALTLGLGYFALTGTYFFFGALPTAVFLGMLLLFTDPSTAPRSELGRVIYGVLYGVSVFVAYGLLDSIEQLTFYDKLLFVPFLNLSVQALDRLAVRPWLKRFDPATLAPRLRGLRRNLAWTAAFALVAGGLLVTRELGTRHPGLRVPFWRGACANGLRNACRNLDTLETIFCDAGSGWACNETGASTFESPARPTVERLIASEKSLARACSLGFAAGCANDRMALSGEGRLVHAPPQIRDYDRLLDTRGLPRQHSDVEVVRWACEQGWPEGCAAAAPARSAP